MRILSKKASPRPKAYATACWNGAGAQTYVSSDFTPRGSIISSGPINHPTLHPVTKRVLLADVRVRECSNIPGRLARVICFAPSARIYSYTSSVTAITSCLRQASPIAVSSSLVKTFPQGLLGLANTKSLVLSEKEDSRSSRLNDQSGE